MKSTAPTGTQTDPQSPDAEHKTDPGLLVLSVWPAPLCAVLCGLFFAPTPPGTAAEMPRALLAVFLAGPLLSFTSAVIVRITAGEGPAVGLVTGDSLPQPVLPYTLPGSLSSSIGAAVQRFAYACRKAPRWAGVDMCTGYLFSIAFLAVGASLLGRIVLLLCLAQAALACFLSVTKLTRRRQVSAMLPSFQTLFAWLVGRVVTSSAIQPIAIVVPALFAASLWDLSTRDVGPCGRGGIVLHTAQLLISVILVLVQRPIEAGVILIACVGSLLLQGVARTTYRYVHHARWLLAIGIVVASAGTTGLG